jgi:hypothetical protein
MIMLRPGLSTALAVQKWSPLVSRENSAPTRLPNDAGIAVGVPLGGWARRKRSGLQVEVEFEGRSVRVVAQPLRSRQPVATRTTHLTLCIATPHALSSRMGG